MSATLIDSDTFAFADGNAGHVCDLGSAPTVGQVDVLCVNSNTVVSTPAGFSVAPSSVGGQGAYVFRRVAAGGEGQTVTITTSGNHDTAVNWQRWGNTIAADQADATPTSGSGNSTPAHNTGSLAEEGELVVAFAALHNIGTANQSNPSWSAGFTPLTTAVQGSGASGVRGYVGYRLDGGPGVESPQVSWSGDPAVDRYMLTLTFTASASVEAVGVATRRVGVRGLAVAGKVVSGVAVLRAAIRPSASLTPAAEPVAVYLRPGLAAYARASNEAYRRPGTLAHRRS